MGCNDRDFEPDQADLDRIAAQQAREARLAALHQTAEETWKRFVSQGLAGITQRELDDHYHRATLNAVDGVRIEELKKEIDQLVAARAERRAQCIHVNRNGRSAFEGTDWYACSMCGDIR